jgi:hypothetical protein
MPSEIEQETPVNRVSAQPGENIDGLPTELLLDILELVVDSETPPELFCLVSRRWHQSVVSCGSLWRHIHITLERFRRVDPETGLVPSIRRHMIRSRGCGLDVTIEFGSGTPWDIQFWDAMLECAGQDGKSMSRWTILKFCAMQQSKTLFTTPLGILDVFRHPTPALRELSICTNKEIDMSQLFPHAPLLRILHAPNTMVTIIWPPTFRRLVSTLHVNNSNHRGFSDLMRRIPSIRTLHLGSTVLLRGQAETIELVQLRELHASVPDVPFHLEYLYLPCLTHLTLTCRLRQCLSPYVVGDTCQSYREILATIKNLTILRMGCSTADELARLLAHAPNVRTLEIQACGKWVEKDDTGRWLKEPVLVEVFYSVLENTELCPHMSHCRLSDVDRLDLVELRRKVTV